MKRRKPKAVGVHIFAGGFTYGVKKAGFNVVCHLEAGKYGVDTAKLNWPELPVYIGDENWPLQELAEEDIDLVYCNPPCAIFSSAGIATTRGPDAWRDDPRLQCWYQAMRVFRYTQPKVFALESVCQAYTKGREVIDKFTKEALSLGYSAQHVLMDSKWTGIPQSRKRFFIVFHKPWIPLEFRFSFKNTVTVGETLAKVIDPGYIKTDRWTEDKACKKVLKATKPGQKLRTVFDQQNPKLIEDSTGKIDGRPSFLAGRLHPEKQMGAFIGDVFIHPHKHRWLGLNEMKAICGYPEEFQLNGKPTVAPGLIARAVLPSVGEWLARSVREVIKQPERKWCGQEVSLIDIRKPDGEYKSLSKEYGVGSGISQLVQECKSCSLCDSMAGKRRLISPVNGRSDASVLVIGEAPGYDESNRGTNGCPLYGGQSGVIFNLLLKAAGIKRNQLFITNAVLCNPGNGKSNRRPTDQEVQNCSSNLQNLVAQVNPKLVITMGNVALEAIKLIEFHDYKLSTSVGKTVTWFNRKLLPVYHPSPKTLSIRPLKMQQRDFKKAKKYAKPLTKLVKPFHINKGAKFKIGMTGFTRAQAFPRTDKDLQRVCNKIDIPAAIYTELIKQGNEVDWQVCPLGESREQFDGLIVMLGLCTSLHGIAYAAQAIWSIHQAVEQGKPCVVFQDDWKIKETYAQLSSFSRSFDTSIQKRYKSYAKCNFKKFSQLKDELTLVASKLTARWPDNWTCLLPMYSGWGDRQRAVKLLQTNHVVAIDATPVVIDLDYKHRPCTIKKRWLLSSLGDHRPWVDSLGLNWPVQYIGHQKCGQRLKTETEVRDAFTLSSGSLSPPYPQAGSGWWRSRYVYAALANRAIFADPLEAEVMGAAYQFDPKEFEQLHQFERKEIARNQRRWLIEEKRVNLHHEQFANEVANVTAALGNGVPKFIQIEKEEMVINNQKVKVVTKNRQISSQKKTSGQFIREQWMTGEYSNVDGPQKLVEEVHRNWHRFSRSTSRECRTKVQDIRWNVKKLEAEGVENVPPFPKRSKR